MSRKELRVLTPGGGLDMDWGVGGGGGEGHGEDCAEEVDDVDWDGEELAMLEVGEGGGVNGAVAPGTAASFRSLSIFSL
jgi:hypothetical protein